MLRTEFRRKFELQLKRRGKPVKRKTGSGRVYWGIDRTCSERRVYPWAMRNQG